MASLLSLKMHRSYNLQSASSETIELNHQEAAHPSEATTSKMTSSGSASTEPDNRPSSAQPHSPQKKRDKYGRGYRVVYLGNVPTYQSGGPDPTSHLVEKLLDACNVQESRMKDAFIDIKSYGLLMYYVDEDCKIYNSKLYDLARISYCQVHENGGFGRGSIVSWIYRQETDTGFQLQCHAVQCTTGRRAHNICHKLFKACHTLYQEVQMAMRTSRLFAEASKRLAPREQEVPDGGQYWNEAFHQLDEDEDGSVLEGQIGQLQLHHTEPLLQHCDSSSSSMVPPLHRSGADLCPSSPSLCSGSSNQEMCFMAEVHAADQDEYLGTALPPVADTVRASNLADDHDEPEAPPCDMLTAGQHNAVDSECDTSHVLSEGRAHSRVNITDFKMTFLESSAMDTHQSFADSSACSSILTPGIPASNIGLGSETEGGTNQNVSEPQSNLCDTDSTSDVAPNTHKLLDVNDNGVCPSLEHGILDSSLEECVASDSDMDTGIDTAHTVDV